MSNSSNSSSLIAPGQRMEGQSSSGNPFVFEGGDVRVLVVYKEQPLVGMICSQCLIHASLVLKRFIFPPWRVAPPFVHSLEFSSLLPPSFNIVSTSPQAPFAEIDCSEDDGDALLVLLNIIHLKHAHIPKRLQFSVLLQVAALCDKYMCVELVQPWLAVWTEKLEFRSKYPMAEQVLFTHWVFGQEQEFELVAKTMVLECKTNEHGQLLNKYNWLWSDPFPPGIAENVLRIRNDTVKALLATPYQMVSKYEKTNDNICQLGDVDGEDNACDGASWGSLTRGMQLASLWPIKPADEVYMSIEEVADAIESIHIYHFVAHHHCGPTNFHAEVTRVLGRIENPVLDIHRRHMVEVEHQGLGRRRKFFFKLEVR
ncbi:hypothetical protein VTL71DRAFT_13208 [Oculimacula yallundae]|uniref:Uncharacterized protein n=1 Tax=Oculimacula yallundae TaxID=86028 RepID=A0ABR4CKB8_9HELO